jgi:hypothetical protein
MRGVAPDGNAAMTPMPRMVPAEVEGRDVNPLKSYGRSPVARFVLIPVALVLLSTFPACAVPPALQLDQPDAKENGAPIITALTVGAQALAEPGPITEIERGRGNMAVTVRDTDVEDTIFIRMFVDYGLPNPTAPRSFCKVLPGTTVSRTISCDISGLCTDGDIDENRLLWIEVFDREPLDSGIPRYRVMPEGGYSSKWSFSLQCQEPS